MSIKLKTYTGAEVTAKDDAILFDTIIGKSGIAYGCEVTHISSNKINVATGKLIIKGRQIDVTEETVLANLSSSGTQNGRLLIHVDLANSNEPVKFITQVASTLEELEQNEDCNIENGVYEYELATYKVTETQIKSLKQTATAIGTNLASLNDSALKIYTTTTEIAITGATYMNYADVTAPITGTLYAAVPVIVNRDSWTTANTPVSVGLQDKETIMKKRIIVNATQKFSSITVKVYWFYTGVVEE